MTQINVINGAGEVVMQVDDPRHLANAQSVHTGVELEAESLANWLRSAAKGAARRVIGQRCDLSCVNAYVTKATHPKHAESVALRDWAVAALDAADALSDAELLDPDFDPQAWAAALPPAPN